MEERLQKLISACGLASRRAAEGWIIAGRVTVNGEKAHLGDRADPGPSWWTGSPCPPAEGGPI